jgi:alpha-L-fucosidase 2
MLLQSHEGEISLLPALPSIWPQGRVTGLRARGGYEVDIAWQDGRLEHATLHTTHAGVCRLRTSAPVSVTRQGIPVPISQPEEGVALFKVEAGHSYAVRA